MQYRRLRCSGLRVSELSPGSWVTHHNPVDVNAARRRMAAAALIPRLTPEALARIAAVTKPLADG